ncbi:MAG: ornithine carbamoyltransferase [Pseudomonadota bacterium]
MTLNHFLDLSDFEPDQLTTMLDAAATMKATTEGRFSDGPLRGKVLAMIFDKPSTRTRVSFDVGMRQLGGETLILSPNDTQLGRGETIADTARVLSRYVDAIMIRTGPHDRLSELAKYATVPVINGLTDDTHPCQIMADVLTMRERWQSLEGRTVAWVGPQNNVLNSFMEAASAFGFKLRIGTPVEHPADPRYLQPALAAGADIETFNDAMSAVAGADAVVTDTWVSMHEDGDGRGHNVFAPFQVNDALMAVAKPDAIFLHCLPAHRNEEVTDAVMDGPQSVVFDEAENRLHAQKAVLVHAMSAG